MKVITIAIDLGKSVFHLLAQDAAGMTVSFAARAAPTARLSRNAKPGRGQGGCDGARGRHNRGNVQIVMDFSRFCHIL